MAVNPFNPEKALDAMWELAPKLAEAKGNRVFLEEYRKTLKAQLMQKHPTLSAAGQEREAYAAPEYVAHLEGLRAAVEQEELLRWRMVSAQASVDVWRSLEASNRTIDRSAQ